MSKYANILENDFAAAPGISVTVFVQGCPHHCPKCFNPETWDFEGGQDIEQDFYENIWKSITKNGLKRNLVIQGGEPLCPENIDFTWSIIKYIKEKDSSIKAYIYTGYQLHELTRLYYHKEKHDIMQNIFNSLEWIKLGPYMWEFRDVTLQYRGSSNQVIVRCPLTFCEKIDRIYIDDDEKIKGEGYGSTDINN